MIALELSRLSGSVASGLILYFECSTNDALIGLGTYFMICDGSDDANLPGKRVAFDRAKIRLSRK